MGSETRGRAGAAGNLRRVAVFSLGPDGNVLSCNAAGRRLLEHHGADLHRALGDPEALAAARAGVACSARLPLNGSVAPAQALWLSILGDGDQRLMAVAAPFDRPPEGAGPVFRGWIDDAPAMVGYLDLNGRWLAANRELQQRLGYPIDELRERRLHDLLSDLDRDVVAERLPAILCGAAAEAVEVRLRARDGEPLDAELTCAPQPSTDGTRGAVCVILRDVRDRRRREAEAEEYTHELERLYFQLERKHEELEALNREIRQARLEALQAEEMARLEQLKTAFLDVAAHELRTPVTLLNGVLQMLEAGLGDENRSLLMESAKRSTTRLAAIVNAALKLLHTGDRAPGLPFRRRSLVETVESAAGDVRPFIELRGQELVVDVAHPVPEIAMDGSMIRDVAVNLLMNAIRFSRDGGRIRVGVAAEGPDHVRFEVADEGLGIRDEDLPHIFDDFFCSLDTLHHSSGQYEYNTRGPGLGLAIVKRFVDHHRGTVQVETCRDVGTTIRIRLPVEQAQSSPQSPPIPESTGR